jgi:uroporphyrinogen III methyltransferase / synthase
MTTTAGKVYLVGAGPGDPGLLTRRGAAVLADADVVVYDHLASPRLLELAPAHALKVSAGKSVGHLMMSQNQINELLIDQARAGRKVVRLKGGDPLLFGRGAEEARHLREAGIAFEIIPGVTAGIGATAYAGIPITLRGVASAVAFVTGHDVPDNPTHPGALDWSKLAIFPGTLVIYMGVTHLERICQSLMNHGKDPQTPAAVIEAGTTPAQRTLTTTLESISTLAATARICPPALLVIGPVVQARESINWFETLPLFGQTIVVTRPIDEAERIAPNLEAMGAEVLIAPAVEVAPIQDSGPLDRAIEHLSDYDWLVFTSAHGVKFFMQRLKERTRDLRALGHVMLAAIGPTTARALEAYHLRADVIPDAYRSEALAAALQPLTRNQRVLLARADRGRTILKDELEKSAHVDQIPVYQNRDIASLDPEILARIECGTVSWITVTSSAIATRFHQLLTDRARSLVGRQIRVVSLSPVTSETLRGLGWNIAAEANPYNWEGLVDALVTSIKRQQ